MFAVDSINYVLAGLLSFPDSPIQLLAHYTPLVRSSIFSLSLPPFYSPGICTFTYIQTYRISIICCGEKNDVRLCTPIYIYIFSCVFPHETPRTIGSMLNMFFIYVYVMVVSSVVRNLVSDTCVAFSKPSRYSSLDLSHRCLSPLF